MFMVEPNSLIIIELAHSHLLALPKIRVRKWFRLSLLEEAANNEQRFVHLRICEMFFITQISLVEHFACHDKFTLREAFIAKCILLVVHSRIIFLHGELRVRWDCDIKYFCP